MEFIRRQIETRVLSLTGLAGATKTVVFQLASLTDAHWHMSGEVILMTLLGGVGTRRAAWGRRGAGQTQYVR